MILVTKSSWGLLMLFNTMACAFLPTPRITFQRTHERLLLATTAAESYSSEAASVLDIATLPNLFPELATSLHLLGFVTPTPIQSAVSQQDNNNNNCLLIAPTGSGKTLAYLIKALTKAIETDGTILMVAPTRELAVQLAKDATALLSGFGNGDASDAVVLAVPGIPLLGENIGQATLLVGTPVELIHVISNVAGGGEFIAGDTLCAIILDEVDVLLPLPPKQLRTSLDDTKGGGPKVAKKKFDTAQDERRKQEQKRKLLTAKRQGAETTNNNKQLIAPTEKLLNLIASNRFVGGDNAAPPLVLAGSATASRRTLDRLNQALKGAAEQGGAATFERVWSSLVKTVRPEEASTNQDIDDDEDGEEKQQHMIRAVSVPQQVKHRYVSLSKEQASSSTAVLAAVAKAASILKPETALVFICGEFAKSISKEKTVVVAKPAGKTSQARRDVLRKRDAIVAKGPSNKSTSSEPLSARRACAMLKDLGIDAQPLHVALGLETDAKEQINDGGAGSRFLVTFEGSARGLHLEEVDAVFVVGRPASAASYLHLAGRVGRSCPSTGGGVEIRPGTVVSLCTKGSATELEKWTKQVGGTDLEEIILITK